MRTDCTALHLPDAPDWPGYCRERARWALDEAVRQVRQRNIPLAGHYLREYVRYDTEAGGGLAGEDN